MAVTRQSYLDRMEQVPAEPFARLLRTLVEREVNIESVQRRHPAHGRHGRPLGPVRRLPRYETVTCRKITLEDYAERFGTSTRTAERHFVMVLEGEQIPVVIADRIAALAGLPLAYVEATG